MQRLIWAVLLSFAIANILGPVFIPWLKKMKFGQKILEIGPKWHQVKEGTPTMGGIIISLFVGWYLDRRMVESEVTNGGRLRFRFFRAYIFLVRYVVPVAIASVFVHELISK